MRHVTGSLLYLLTRFLISCFPTASRCGRKASKSNLFSSSSAKPSEKNSNRMKPRPTGLSTPS
uniref:Indole-3-acetate beta-glucosyltransferase-like protein n=1 Tax=Arabidopsis thaliana TaxID=3702 RepID=Q8LPG7_ARATH|nr:indole-3-acetate beta-glucosyltransferase-like protein [Arabidopsis thaliana]